jgi:hypothetical protein
MNKRMIALRALMGMTVIATVINGCRRTDDLEDLLSGQDNALSEQGLMDMQDMADEAAKGNLSSFKTSADFAIVSDCAVITHDTVSDPRVLTIDFGTGCVGNDGRTRSGKVIVTYTGPYAEPGHLHTITTDNYFVNGNQILGTKTVMNEGLNDNGNIWFTVTIDAQIIKEDGTTIDWDGNRTREWVGGYSTPERSDDVYLISGTHSGQSSDGRSFTAQTLEPIRKDRTCSWITDGVLEVTPNSRPTRTIDFGDGTCDDDATVTVNGNSHAINLH